MTEIFNPSNYYFNATEEFDLQDLKLLKKTSGVWKGKDWISAGVYPVLDTGQE
ncbi:MAG: hypothetical protein AABY79_03450 [Nitrospirota bacterium]|jgi:hypothetical protein